MKTLFSRISVAFTALAFTSVLAPSAAFANEAQSLDELLNMVKQGKVKESREIREREARFLRDKSQQASELANAKKLKKQEEERSAELEKQFAENKETIIAKLEAYKVAKGELNELFGHINSSAGDLRDVLSGSLTGVQYDGREEFLTGLIEKLKGDQLPEISEIETLWSTMLNEIVESGKVVKLNTGVATADGQTNMDVVRVGAYNIVNTQGEYLKYEDGVLSVLPRQPKASFVTAASELANLPSGSTRMGIDPTGPMGGGLLSAFIDSPTLEERWHQGGIVGYIISGVGVFAMLIALWRMIALTITGMKVNGQLKSEKANTGNPLGRVLAVSEENPSIDTETLDLKLNEAVLKEIPKLENSLTLLKIIAAVAPLLGLLGTVTGMILTFQAITIFGAGDPKAMAGGISSALITTVLGLVVAIPTLLAHTMVSGRAKRIIHVLEEQAAGIIARNTEKTAV